MSIKLSHSARFCRLAFSFSLCLSFVFLISAGASAQVSQSYNREMGRTILGMVQSDIKKNYYDPTFHGIDLDAHYKEAEEKIKQATSLNDVWALSQPP